MREEALKAILHYRPAVLVCPFTACKLSVTETSRREIIFHTPPFRIEVPFRLPPPDRSRGPRRFFETYPWNRSQVHRVSLL